MGAIEVDGLDDALNLGRRGQILSSFDARRSNFPKLMRRWISLERFLA